MKNHEKEVWRIEVSEYPRGDLYELVLKKSYAIYHKDIEDPFYVFEGETEADYTGGGWEQTGESGVKEVEIDGAGGFVLATYQDGEVKRYPLRLPFEDQTLTPAETEILMPFFLDFQKKEAYYLHTEEWSYDISIPQEAIEKAQKASEDALAALIHQLFLLGFGRHREKVSLPEGASKKRGYGKINLRDFGRFLDGHYAANK